jgi:hypothetical protein
LLGTGQRLAAYLHHQRLHQSGGRNSGIAGGPVVQRQYGGRTGGGYIMPISADYSYFDDDADFPALNNIDYITGIFINAIKL